jgi:hypothetical protein
MRAIRVMATAVFMKHLLGGVSYMAATRSGPDENVRTDGNLEVSRQN